MEIDIKKNGRFAGLIYVLLMVFGIFAQVIRTQIIKQNESLETIKNLIENEFLFKLSFLSDLLMIICYIVLGFTLYRIFREFNNNWSLLMLIFVLVSSAVYSLNMLNQFAAAYLVKGVDLNNISIELTRNILLFLELHKSGYLLSQIIGFGPWLFPAGLLIYKSGYLPKFIGILLMIACFGHIIEAIVYFLVPKLEVITYPGLIIAMLGEFSFCFWLLIMGANKKA